MADGQQVSASGAPRKYTLFVSHKAKDNAVATQLKELLDANTGEHVEVFISENIQKGTDWRDVISAKLTASSFLILLFVDPKEDWGWCLYETGFFDALTRVQSGGSKRLIYCLHHEKDSPPDPIANLQAISATPSKVEEWLKQLYEIIDETSGKKDARIARASQTAVEICRLFGKQRMELYSEFSIFMNVRDKSRVSINALPDDTLITGDETIIDQIFQKWSKCLTWGEVRQWANKNPNSEKANSMTLMEITRAIALLTEGKAIQPIQGVLFAGEGPKRYRPVIYRLDELRTGEIECEMVIVEDVGGQLQNVQFAGLLSLLTSIRMAIRVRWEVLRPFAGKIRTLGAINPRKLRSDLQTCFNNIFGEAEFRSLFDPNDLFMAFDAADQAKFISIKERFDSVYPRIWKAIGFPDSEFTFGEVLREPFGDDQMKDLESALKELEEMNTLYLEMSLARAQALLNDEMKSRLYS